MRKYHHFGRRSVRLTVAFVAVFLYASCVVRAQSSAPAFTPIFPSGARCADPIPVCAPVLQTPFLTDSTFLQDTELPILCGAASSGTPGGGRVNGLWYKIAVHQSGDLGFGIQPLNQNGSRNTSANLDWALYRLNDTLVCGRLGEPVRCNFAPDGGLTGAVETAHDELAPSLSEPVRNVKPGDVFLLLVLNPDNHRFGYSIDMGFSTVSTLAEPPSPQMQSLSAPSGVCQTNALTVRFSGDIAVQAVTSGVFSIMSARGIARVVTSVSSQRFGITTSASSSAFDNSFTLFLDQPIAQSEEYTVRLERALPALCQVLAAGAEISAYVAVGPRIDITGFREYCNQGAKLSASGNFRQYFWENARTGASVGTSQTVVVPIGEYRLTVVDNNGCQASTSAFVVSTSAIQLSLTAKGNKTSFCNYDDGRDGVLLQATPGFDRYEWFFNGSPTTGVVTTGTTSEKYVVGSPGLYTVRAYVNGCESVSNSIRVNMLPVPAKPSIRRSGNFFSVVNPVAGGGAYFWVRRLNGGRLVGVENGWDCAPATSGTYFVRLSNPNGCFCDSDTMSIVITPARFRLETGSYSAEQNRQFDMQYRFATLENTAQLIGATGITFTLRFNATLLTPFPPTQRGIMENRRDTATNRFAAPNRFVTLSFPLPSGGVSSSQTAAALGSIRYLAAIGNTTATFLFLENISFPTPTGKPIQGVTVDTTLGVFRLLNAGPFFGGNSQSEPSADVETTLHTSLQPNPSDGRFTLHIETARRSAPETLVSAWIQDAMGNRIKTLFTDAPLTTGAHRREIDVHDIPTGAYFLIVRSGAAYKTTILSVKK